MCRASDSSSNLNASGACQVTAGSRQVSDEFDQYMERASLEALMALAMLCKEAREARPPPCATPLSVPPTLQRCVLALPP